jgi:hypothetical protein
VGGGRKVSPWPAAVPPTTASGSEEAGWEKMGAREMGGDETKGDEREEGVTCVPIE